MTGFGRIGIFLCAGLLGIKPAWPVGFPDAIDHVLQLRSSAQYQSNPARLPDTAQHKQGTPVLVNSVGVAARIPLLSDDTRLDIAGTLADARYASEHQLDHRPVNLDTTLHWRAGRLFRGNVNYHYEKYLNFSPDPDRAERDLVSDSRWATSVGLRVTEQLTLPLITLFEQQKRYDDPGQRELYNRKEHGWQAAVQYSGMGRSLLQAGVNYTETDFPLRVPDANNALDDNHKDREVFAEGLWELSVKTTVGARIGYLQRRYGQYSDRDQNFSTFLLKASWDYSPKTGFNAWLWRQPYAQDDDASVLYAVRTGGRLGVTWRPTVKTTLGLNLERIRQTDKRIAADDRTRNILRLGTRLSWQPYDNTRWILEWYRSREHADSAYSSYSQSYVRFGVEFLLDSGKPELSKGLQPKACDYRFVDYSLC